MKVLSICIPTFNRSSFVISQLDFLKKEIMQNEFSLEVLVSDNNSEIYHKDILNSYSRENDFFKLYNQNENLGLIGNINFLLSESNSEFVWFVGDDDILLEGVLERIFSILKRNLNLSYIFLNYKVFKWERQNIIAEFDLEVESGVLENGQEFLINLFDRYGSIMMFITSNVYSSKILKGYVDSNLSELSIESPLTYSFLCSSFGFSYVEVEIFILDRIGSVSWAKQSIKVFSWGVPIVLLNLSKVIPNISHIKIKNILMNYYNKGRGNYILMLIFSPLNIKFKLTKFLGMWQLKLLPSSLLDLIKKVTNRLNLKFTVNTKNTK